MVDARIGPGIKSMTKFKKRKEEQLQLQNESTEFAGQSNSNAQNIRNNTMERFGKIFKKIQKKKTIQTRSCDENSQPTSPSSSSDNEENRLSDDASDRLECDEDMSSIIEDVKGSIAAKRIQRKQKKPTKNLNKTLLHASHILDLNLWKQRKTCCGMYYESKKFGAILVETSQYSVKTCSVHAKKVPFILSEKQEELIKLPTAIKSLPPKKQHFLRHSLIDPISVVEPMEQSVPIDYSKPTTTINQIAPQPKLHSTIDARLHKLRSDTSKVVKKAPKKNSNAIKNLVKLCTSNKIVNAMNADSSTTNETNENKNITNTTVTTTVTATKTEPIAVNKYSDNSSDSGYDETLHDTTQLNQIAKIGTTRPVILSNGIKLHVKPENLLLAANLAGVSQTAIQSTQVNCN